MLEERATLPALGAADELPASDGDLVGPRTAEAERRRPGRPAPDQRHQVGRHTQPPEPGGEPLPEHAVGLEHVVRAGKVAGRATTLYVTSRSGGSWRIALPPVGRRTTPMPMARQRARSTVSSSGCA